MHVKSMAVCTALALGIAVPPVQAQLQAENLLVTLPPGFKLGFQDSRNGVNLQEWVPAGETVQNWSEMVTVQIFLSRRDLEPVQIFRRIEQGWLGACKESAPASPQIEKVNGYAAATMLLRCPLLSSTGKPETTMFRAVKGNDSFYMVQRAMRAVPTPEQLDRMKQYLATVSVCDARSSAHPCPALTPLGVQPAK